MRYTVVDKMAIVWNSVPVPGSFVDCCLLHVGSGPDHHAQLTLLLNGSSGLHLTCEHTQDNVTERTHVRVYHTQISRTYIKLTILVYQRIR